MLITMNRTIAPMTASRSTPNVRRKFVSETSRSVVSWMFWTLSTTDCAPRNVAIVL